MADDTNFRSYRQNDPRSRAPAAPSPSARPGSDPLAELARLIGQTDPFSELGRGGAQRPPRQAPAATPQHPAPAAPAYPQNPFNAPPAPQHSNPPPFESQAPMEPRRSGFQPAYDPAIYGAPPAGPQAYYEDAGQMPQGEEGYDDEFAEARPRRGMKTVTMLVGLALLGTGAAFGYRFLFTGGTSGPPPVIKADSTPSKVPATNAGASKVIYDRVGDPNRAEKIVPREEQPVDVPADARAAPRGVVFPGLPESADASGAASAPLGSMPPGPNTAEPKKIRTVTIRPDQPLGDAAAPSANAPASRSSAPSAPAPRSVAAPPVAPQPPQANAPLSLNPQGLNSQMSSAPPAAAPAAAPPAPARIAPAPDPTPVAVETGSYAVQISSQRSEAEAQASFRSLAAKFPNLLGNRQPLIRRADLGEKGIYFRTMVGPFAALDEASQFCTNLKAAGGQCVVQRN